MFVLTLSFEIFITQDYITQKHSETPHEFLLLMLLKAPANAIIQKQEKQIVRF